MHTTHVAPPVRTRSRFRKPRWRRATGKGLEKLRQRCWNLHQEGLSYSEISKRVGKVPSVVGHHVRSVRQELLAEVLEEMDSGKKKILGGVLLEVRLMTEQAWKSLDKAELGTLVWVKHLEQIAKLWDRKVNLLFDSGIIPKYRALPRKYIGDPEFEEARRKAWRKSGMSIEEIEEDSERMRQELIAEGKLEE